MTSFTLGSLNKSPYKPKESLYSRFIGFKYLILFLGKCRLYMFNSKKLLSFVICSLVRTQFGNSLKFLYSVDSSVHFVQKCQFHLLSTNLSSTDEIIKQKFSPIEYHKQYDFMLCCIAYKRRSGCKLFEKKEKKRGKITTIEYAHFFLSRTKQEKKGQYHIREVMFHSCL